MKNKHFFWLILLNVFCILCSTVGFGFLLKSDAFQIILKSPESVDGLKNLAPMLGGIAAVMSVATALVNVGIGIVFFTTEQQRKKDENMLLRKQFWLREVFLKRKIENLESFFEIAIRLSTIHIVPNISPNPGEISALRDSFNAEKRSLSSSLLVEMSILNLSLCEELDHILDNLQDLVMQCASGDGSHVCFREHEIYSKIQNKKKEFLKKVYDFEMELV